MDQFRLSIRTSKLQFKFDSPMQTAGGDRYCNFYGYERGFVDATQGEYIRIISGALEYVAVLHANIHEAVFACSHDEHRVEACN